MIIKKARETVQINEKKREYRIPIKKSPNFSLFSLDKSLDTMYNIKCCVAILLNNCLIRLSCEYLVYQH